MDARKLFYALLVWSTYSSSRGDERNLSPVFTQDMNNLALSESTPVGLYVYTLQGEDPEGAPIRYGLEGTDKFQVDPRSGDVTLVEPLDREINDTLKFRVFIEEETEGGESANPNKVEIAVSVIVLDENDNAPAFTNSPYQVTVSEDEALGTTVLAGIAVQDLDSVGDNLEVECVPHTKWPEACDVFGVVALQSSQSEYTGSLVLNAPLNYNKRQIYQLHLVATDGVLNSTSTVTISVQDVQNLPPVFTGPLTAELSEDAPIGTLVVTLRARDGDLDNQRAIRYDLLTNPLDFFLLDSTTGELKTAKPLNREALADPSAPLNITVRAREVVNGQPATSESTATVASLLVRMRDVNDEPPRFNRPEYSVEIPESLRVGEPLPDLDMTVTDTDSGANSEFSLRLSDVSGAFVVEPETAVGRAAVTIRLNNSKLDYEQTDMNKFIIVVIAEELHTSPRLSSRATLVVRVTDANDNAPRFADEAYWSSVSEVAGPRTHVLTATATDRDTGRLGTEGIVYQLFGTGAELFTVDNRSGIISVAACPTPGKAPCLDRETTKNYLLTLKATDEDGQGMTSVVPVKISLADHNDNPPVFANQTYRAVIDEDSDKFDPEVQVIAEDRDETSEVRYAIQDDSSARHQFWIDSATGKLGVVGQVTANDQQPVYITIVATDGVYNATCQIVITVRDVNNHAPIFQYDTYNVSIAEDAPIGTEVATLKATDLDIGENARIAYKMQVGSQGAFAVNNETGVVAVATKLDYDRKNTYHMHVVAQDQGVPSLTGTTELVVNIVNVNDKKPFFTPHTQTAEVSEDAEIGSLVHTLMAVDPDIVNIEDLRFQLDQDRPVRAVDPNGNEVKETEELWSWFVVSPSGGVLVGEPLLRSRAAALRLPVLVEDTTAAQVQSAQGELVINITAVNRYPPVFNQSHYSLRLEEEVPPGTPLAVLTATDRDSTISHYAIEPENEYFAIDNKTGEVTATRRIDYETVRRIDFTVVSYDGGVPQLSSNATVTVDVVNVNDERPRFEADQYNASVLENAKEGTPVLTLRATDDDEGQFGEVRYSLVGEDAARFSVEPLLGEVSVARAAELDREVAPRLRLAAVATDVDPAGDQHSTHVPIYITILDENDNAPVFTERVYRGAIFENVALDPPEAVLQVQAVDRDIGVNAEIAYTITQQSVPGAFRVDAATGAVYPALPLEGNVTYGMAVLATDGNGKGPHSDIATVEIYVKSVNKHAPVFVTPADGDSHVEIPENSPDPNLLLTRVQARDDDPGENGRVTYYLRVGGNDTSETEQFAIDERTGELWTKTSFDREETPEYELTLVARDHGETAFETLKKFKVIIRDEDDNTAQFEKDKYEFYIPENEPTGTVIGTVKAIDKDAGENGLVYYHLLEGNKDGGFTLNRMTGVLQANVSFDREKRSEYLLSVYASGSPLLERADFINSVDPSEGGAGDRRGGAVAVVSVNVTDRNDNPPAFDKDDYYSGVRASTGGNVTIARVRASDADLAPVKYVLAASNLLRAGEKTSSGSIVPSPFLITQRGDIVTVGNMSDYNQERFVLDVIAQEGEPPYREAKSHVHVWVVSGEQSARVVLSRPCSEAARATDALEERLSATTGLLVVVGDTREYRRVDTAFDESCELSLHGVDRSTSEALSAEALLAALDSRYDQLSALYKDAGIDTLAPAEATEVEEKFDPALAALIALMVVLFAGLVMFLVVCACLRRCWSGPPPSLQSSKGGSLARRRILDELSTTENPLWLETKLRPYEEQELTMNVFGELDAQQQADNTYATIQTGAQGAERDYATLGGCGASPTALEAMLGFQGSTFQPPPAPDTPEPPPRPPTLTLI